MIEDLTKLRVRLECASTTQELMDTTFEIVKHLGAINVCYAHAPPLGATDYKRPSIVDARGLPKGWARTYLKSGYAKADAISRLALSQLRPFYWRDVGKMKPLSPREQQYIEHLITVGLDHGICVPTFGPKGRAGYFGVGFCPTEPRLNERQFQIIQWLCQTAHICHCSIIDDSSSGCIHLSAREIDVLRLILVGRTNSEIAKELKVSCNTVSTYLVRACEKLEVRGRFEAAMRALTTGLLD
ncbi:MAG: LuxR family transcriptional regulator [Pseudomonadota bacterium]